MLFSVVVQGTSIPFVAPRLGVPMRIAEPHALGRAWTSGTARVPRAGRSRVLPLADRTWIEAIERDGRELPAARLDRAPGRRPVRLITDLGDLEALRRLFGS